MCSVLCFSFLAREGERGGKPPSHKSYARIFKQFTLRDGFHGQRRAEIKWRIYSSPETPGFAERIIDATQRNRQSEWNIIRRSRGVFAQCRDYHRSFRLSAGFSNVSSMLRDRNFDDDPAARPSRDYFREEGENMPIPQLSNSKH